VSSCLEDRSLIMNSFIVSRRDLGNMYESETRCNKVTTSKFKFTKDRMT
jgi:hypothetical protein